MVLIGLVLVAAAVGFTIDVFVQNTASIDVDVLGRTFVVRPGWLVVAGLVAVVVLLIGVRLVVGGLARSRRRRTELRTARVAARERDSLAEQLEVERAERELAERTTSGHDDHPANSTEVRSAPVEQRSNPAGSVDNTAS
jgi:FtsZ-interacting cell division protein ZipA